MEYSGILFALLATLSWSFCIFPFTQAARRLGSNSLNHFRLLLATILIGIISILISPQHFADLFSSPYQQAWIWLGVSGVLGLTIGDYFGFEMYAILGPRLGSVLTTFAPAAALILGTILLDEHISLIGIIGMLITILGVIAISLGKSERSDSGSWSWIHQQRCNFRDSCCCLSGCGTCFSEKRLAIRN
ncbi:MAG: DMT family transporter [Bacteroidetes bacterium]|nr:DMT family transporter [Bacteroidota bacterium]